MNTSISRIAIAGLLFASDLVGIILCFNFAFLVRLERLTVWNSPLLYVLTLACLLGLYLADTYRLEIEIAGLWTPARVLVALFSTLAVTTSVIYLTGLWGSGPIVGRGILLLSIGFFAVWAVASRILASRWVIRKIDQSRWLILGYGKKIAQLEAEYLRFHPRSELVLLTDNKNYKQPIEFANCYRFIDSIDRFEEWSQQHWFGVLLDETLENLPDEMIRKLMEMRLRGVYIYSLADFYEQIWEKIPPASIKDDWFAFTSGFSLLHNRINTRIKRLIDFLLTGFVLLITLPIILIVIIAIKLDSPGPIFYSQNRTGFNGKPFKVHKFRSMYQHAEKQGAQWACKKDSRITKVGYFIRITRIDELPQLWNVLKGEMSLIGPRPERPEFDVQLREQIPYYDVRYLVKPGITGWAQVKYPYGASVEDAYQKVAYDLYYIKNYSLLLDLAIVLKTIRIVFLGKGR